MPNGPPEKKEFAGEPIPPAGEQLTNLAARLRLSEERYVELRKKLTLVEQNMLQNHKKAITELKTLSSEILDINKKILQIEDRVITIIKEIGLLAKKEDIDVMKRYVELWNPAQFVNAERVEQLIKDILEETTAKKPERAKPAEPKPRTLLEDVG